MSMEDDDLYDLIVVWPPVGRDNRGERIFEEDNRLELPARFQKYVREVMPDDDTSEEKLLRIIVNQEIQIGSAVFLGSENELPSPLTDLYRVVSYSCIPDIMEREFRRSISVTRMGNKLPVSA